jgi:hypothetical protein
LAGDFNVTQPRDLTEPQSNGFRNAYLNLGGVEGVEEGATWGFQNVDWKRWGRKRLDKEVFWGKLAVRSLRRVGVSVEVADGAVKKKLAEDDELPYVTDHYDLMGKIEVEDGIEVCTSEETTSGPARKYSQKTYDLLYVARNDESDRHINSSTKLFQRRQSKHSRSFGCPGKFVWQFHTRRPSRLTFRRSFVIFRYGFS